MKRTENGKVVLLTNQAASWATEKRSIFAKPDFLLMLFFVCPDTQARSFFACLDGGVFQSLAADINCGNHAALKCSKFSTKNITKLRIIFHVFY